jgi:hypothetical protein
MHFMVTQGIRDRKTLRVNYPMANKKQAAGEMNPATQQIDFYIRSPQQNPKNRPNREVFMHFFGMEVTLEIAHALFYAAEHMKRPTGRVCDGDWPLASHRGGALRPTRALIVGVAAIVVLVPSASMAQESAGCRLICELEWLVEPTVTIENLANRHQVVTPDGVTEHVNHERVFEIVLAVDMSTKAPWLGFTVEAIFSPFSDDNSVELEFESNWHWLTESMTGGWVTSHFDVVDQFSPAERPESDRAYTHKLDFELDTALHVFNWLPEGRWLRGVEVETSLDYLATGLPKKGDIFPDGTQFLDDASHWSLSFVFVIPVAPF